jgi:hypothetical protein
MTKPAMLQINTAGAWRNVVEFDVANTDATDRVLEAGATLAAYGLNSPKVRIVKMEGGYAAPLLRWCPKTGWRQVRTHADAEDVEA